MTLKQAMELYHKNLITLQKSSETIRSYMKDMKLFSESLYEKYNGEVYVDEITTDDIEEYLYYTRVKKNYAPASRRRVVITLKSFFTFSIKKAYCTSNPAKEVAYIKLDYKERVNLTENEIQALVKNTDEPLIRLVFQTLYYTGIRVSECVNLTINDVDFVNNIILVKLGKGNKDRSIPMNDKLKPLLYDYMKLWRNNKTSDKFFCTKSGSIHPSYINRKLKISAKKAGINKHVTAHILRHSFASNLLKNGVDILRIQKLLGHSSIKTTSIYTHTNIVDLGQAVNAL
ncbi:site-specific tyrosine recombinase/integron integrase [Clostridium sp. YIM B02551]|uniref:site-specific tyrosine recombinase/integron integrase n=1 Tax=Clostridium sp. YIM B02551 TaxID=2910679 RepID=UPI001EEAC54E|nr:site-specific tyrosine recombinase/integron integrase [Clostridium sp. YIM B02551]